jgi:hypothetical protein
VFNNKTNHETRKIAKWFVKEEINVLTYSNFFMQNYTKHFYILSECGQASNQPIDINFFSFSAIDQVVTVIRTIKHQAFCRVSWALLDKSLKSVLLLEVFVIITLSTCVITQIPVRPTQLLI